MNELMAQQGQKGVVVPSLRRKERDRAILLDSLGALYTQGHAVAWQTLYDHEGSFVRLPSYPWQFETYWTESLEACEDRFYTEVHHLADTALQTWLPTAKSQPMRSGVSASGSNSLAPNNSPSR